MKKNGKGTIRLIIAGSLALLAIGGIVAVATLSVLFAGCIII